MTALDDLKTAAVAYNDAYTTYQQERRRTHNIKGTGKDVAEVVAVESLRSCMGTLSASGTTLLEAARAYADTIVTTSWKKMA